MFKNTDKTSERILNAQRVVVLATQLLDRQQRDERSDKEKNQFFEKSILKPDDRAVRDIADNEQPPAELTDKNAAQ